MKKIIVLLTLSFLSLQSCKDHVSKDGNVKISGEIKGLKQGTLYIQQLSNNQIHTLDSIVFKGKSTFETAFDLKEAEMLYLTLDRGNTLSEDNSLLFFAEPGNLTIHSTLSRFYSDAEIKGSASHDVYKKYLDSRKRISDKKNELIKEEILASKYKNITKVDSLHKYLVATEKRMYLNAVNFAYQNNSSPAAAYIVLTDIIPLSGKYVDSLYNHFTDDVKSHKYGKLIEEYKRNINIHSR